MNVPENMRAFDCLMAQQGHPLCTRDGRNAKFIAYVPDAITPHQLVIQVDDEVYTYSMDGTSYGAMDKWDLFLSPLGMCQGKPVFAGDVLTLKDNPLKTDFIVPVKADCFDQFQWPSKALVVETRMSDKELEQAYWDGQQKLSYVSEGAKSVANKAIERAIADGDVIPTSVVAKLAGDAYNKRMDGGFSYVEYFNDVLNEYLEGLK